MDLFVLNTVQNLSLLGCVLEQGSGQRKMCGFGGRYAALFAGRFGWKGDRGSSVERIREKRHELIVQPCDSNHESRLLLGHCFGVKPTPGGRLALLLRLRRLRLRFPSATDPP